MKRLLPADKFSRIEAVDIGEAGNKDERLKSVKKS
jgi:hypothetical protein